MAFSVYRWCTISRTAWEYCAWWPYLRDAAFLPKYIERSMRGLLAVSVPRMCAGHGYTSGRVQRFREELVLHSGRGGGDDDAHQRRRSSCNVNSWASIAWRELKTLMYDRCRTSGATVLVESTIGRCPTSTRFDRGSLVILRGGIVLEALPPHLASTSFVNTASPKFGA